MSDELTIQGTLAEATTPDLCRSLIRSGETAIVTLEAIGRHDSIYFRDGKIVYATTSDPDLGLAEVLLRRGEIGVQEYRRAIESMTGAQHVGSVLVALKYLKANDLMRAVERQVCDIVVHALSFRSGSYLIEFITGGFDRDIPNLAIPTERLLMDGIEKIEYWSLISRGLGQMQRLLKKEPTADSRMYHIELTDEEAFVLELLAEPQSVGTICSRSYLSNFLTCRLIWALLVANLVEDQEGEEHAARRTEVRSEMELESLVERYNAAFQSIFAVVFQKIGDSAYDFIDRVVAHLSPETLPYLIGINLSNEGRVDFDQLLNNLISSGANDKGVVVDNVLSELLYGWIYETRTEFHAELDDDVNAIVARLK
ncbi:MAG TPA: DUF4388 domain-containing protein [Thermoanaerobaculia bacterium]|nr:DUF4388 domain-containing protein [Thermoanaerobaculia bacterium]